MEEIILTTEEERFKKRHTFTLENPVISWSSYSSFLYNREQWYEVYVKGKKITSKELEFGKKVAHSMGTKHPLAPFTRLSEIEHEFDTKFGNIRIVGSMDTFDAPRVKRGKCLAGEFKTGKQPWTQKRVEDHGQLKMYTLLLWQQHKIYPEDVQWFLEWAETYETGDYKIEFVKPFNIQKFYITFTTVEIMRFASEVKLVHAQMIGYVKQRALYEHKDEILSGKIANV